MSLISHASFPTTTAAREDGREKNAKKRTRDETETVELDRRPFTIRPDTSDPFGAPRNFTPVCFLSRSQLPLAYLDSSTTSNRLFTAHIQAFEVHDEGEDGAKVLIAEDKKEGRLYAIESAERRTYALCKLSNLVVKGSLESVGSVSCCREEQQPKRRALQPADSGQPWWTRATVEVPSQDVLAEPASCVPRLSMLSSSSGCPIQTPAPNAAKAISIPDAEPCGLSTRNLDTAHESVDAQPSLDVKTPEGVLQELMKHYLEALYLSRTSLAYFTKGPLSRARAAFAGEPHDDLEISVLIAGLRDAILTASVMDKKYRDATTGIVKDLPPRGLETPDKPAKKKPRKWKAKRDKAGFWNDERGYLEKWWREHDESSNAPSSVETVENGLRRRVPRLRSRETYLQVMLALEVLALERSFPPKSDQVQTTESQGAETQAVESQAPADIRKPKAKKLQDLPALLDVLLDRLCIWHSLDSHSPTKKGDEKSTNEDEESSDELKSFCVEVIIPFYMSRIPQHAAMVNKKLGGPSAPTPIKRKSTSTRKPGEPATRQPPEKKPRKPLSRVASEAINHASKQPPMLHRAATDSDVLEQHIKREGSEVPTSMDIIPQAKVPQPRKRTSLMHSISFSRREVDLSAMSQANDAKMRKKADVDEKLRDALTALKKPNRSLALKEVAENADMSFAKATARSRPGGKRQAGAKDAIHVTATPKHPRTFKATPGRTLGTSNRAGGGSGATYVPSSSARLLAPPPAHDVPPSSSFAVPQTGHRPRHTTTAANVDETPSRGFAKFMPSGLAHQPGALESPIATRHSQAQIGQTPVKPIRSLSLVPPAQETLIEASPNAVRVSSPKKAQFNPAPRLDDGDLATKSVYDALGWDDEPYEALA